MSTRKSPGVGEVADALSEMTDLADAWATCGPEGYTPQERPRRNRADQVLARVQRHLAKTGGAK
jgi:hypothetical protein